MIEKLICPPEHPKDVPGRHSAMSPAPSVPAQGVSLWLKQKKAAEL